MRCNDDKQIVISRVLAGGVASRSGVLHPGDIVHEINDKSLEGWSIDGVATFMVSGGRGGEGKGRRGEGRRGVGRRRRGEEGKKGRGGERGIKEWERWGRK